MGTNHPLCLQIVKMQDFQLDPPPAQDGILLGERELNLLLLLNTDSNF